MITRVEIDGFRNFLDFEVSLRPLQIIAGPNSSGKSNFFDALMLLSRLAAHDSLRVAFEGIRGEPLEQFTASGPGRYVRSMTLAVEAIVPRTIRDPWGGKEELRSTHLRYSINLVIDDMNGNEPMIKVASESLRRMRRSETEKRLAFVPGERFIKDYLKWGSSAPDFISTGHGRISLHQDGQAGRKREYHPAELQGTVLSAANTSAFRHAFAMRQELCSIGLLQLEPRHLREPSTVNVFQGSQEQHLEIHGGNLPAVLARLNDRDTTILPRVATDLRAVVADAKDIEVWKDELHKRWVARVEFTHGGPFPASLLSDGTLRILALAAMKHDREHHGVLCFEEPENGIHPLRMKGLLKILRGLATDVSKQEAMKNELRQLLVNTHSPALVSIAPHETLLFAETARQFRPNLDAPVLIGRFLEVADELPLRVIGEKRSRIARQEVLDYLSSVERDSWQKAEE